LDTVRRISIHHRLSGAFAVVPCVVPRRDARYASPIRQYPYAMSLAVTHIEDAPSIDEHAMRPGKRAVKRVRFRAVTPLPGAKNRSDDARLQVDDTNDVILGIGNVERVAPPRQAFRPSQSCGARGSAIAGVALLAGPGYVV